MQNVPRIGASLSTDRSADRKTARVKKLRHNASGNSMFCSLWIAKQGLLEKTQHNASYGARCGSKSENFRSKDL
ncbi:hypothetical protein AB3N59_18845 [Leptospira sp. WS92.C1]